jgi:hypothetical protein
MVVITTTHIIIIIHGGTTDIETLSTFREDTITGLHLITGLMQQGMVISAGEGNFNTFLTLGNFFFSKIICIFATEIENNK